MIVFPIYFSDLIPETQKKLMEAIGIENPKEMNWDMDILPLVTYEVEEEQGND